jgi:hypothetical protein
MDLAESVNFERSAAPSGKSQRAELATAEFREQVRFQLHSSLLPFAVQVLVYSQLLR